MCKNGYWRINWIDKEKQEVTIQQLKEILQPMEKFTNSNEMYTKNNLKLLNH